MKQEVSLRFPIAPMDTLFRTLTGLLWLLPVGFLVYGVSESDAFAWAVGLATVVVYGLVWVFRPRAFALSTSTLDLEFPVFTRRIDRGTITSAEVLEGDRFSQEHGWGMRVGAGGLFGAFGLLVCKGVTFEMYVSRRTDLVVVHRQGARPLLISPDDPAGFVAALG